MGDLSLHDLVRRLSRRARLDRALDRGLTGLLFGLAAGIVVALIAGAVRLPLPPAVMASAAAAAGFLSGGCAGLLTRIDTGKLLISTDKALESREIISTAYELARGAEKGTFTDAVIQDGTAVLRQAPARRALGPLRLRALPFLPLLAALLVLSLVFPIDWKGLFGSRAERINELATIGEELEGSGQRLEEAARAENLGRSLALSQELAQLGRDLADRKIDADDALERMSDLEHGLAQEYAIRRLPSGSPEDALPSGSGSGSDGTSSPDASDGRRGEQTDASSSAQDLSDAINRLRDAQQRLRNNPGSTAGGNAPSTSPSQGSARQGTGSGSSSGRGSGSAPDAEGDANGAGGSNPSDDGGLNAAGGAPGVDPALQKTGPPTDITRSGQDPALRASGTPGEGDSTSFLVRALPEWTGSKMPAETVRRQYAQSAESALARDEIPPKLKASVRDYFTAIGMAPDKAQ